MKHNLLTVKKAVNGDGGALESLLVMEERMLYAKALSYVGNKEDALYVIQETAYRAFIGIKKLRNIDYFSTWLFRILIRECYTLLKKKGQMIPYDERELMIRLESKQDKPNHRPILEEALSQLKPSFRVVIILFYYHDLSISDIAVITDKPVGTIKTNLRRARKQLKIDLEGSDLVSETATY
ncbi:sigma-70 family RNA polymerase sigma factor [Shouchella lehensis]|uniref:RNA polymerase sigma factor n=1 Tax=Shouchella lehensis G1 TaxID=1246626 RepID=A0A060LXR4_9BACI|nr:sigma-70 family RNA polymerase sigma factor [Shouchella lehensis]AIC96056.1 RNA polymerase sigma factor [Shouchella lehensis G1]